MRKIHGWTVRVVLADTAPGAVFSFYLVPRSKLVPNHVYAFFINQLVWSSRTCLGVLGLLSEWVASAQDNTPRSSSAPCLCPHTGRRRQQTAISGNIFTSVSLSASMWLGDPGYYVSHAGLLSRVRFQPLHAFAVCAMPVYREPQPSNFMGS